MLVLVPLTARHCRQEQPVALKELIIIYYISYNLVIYRLPNLALCFIWLEHVHPARWHFTTPSSCRQKTAWTDDGVDESLEKLPYSYCFSLLASASKNLRFDFIKEEVLRNEVHATFALVTPYNAESDEQINTALFKTLLRRGRCDTLF